jgi:hypothetical protein
MKVAINITPKHIFAATLIIIGMLSMSACGKSGASGGVIGYNGLPGNGTINGSTLNCGPGMRTIGLAGGGVACVTATSSFATDCRNAGFTPSTSVEGTQVCKSTFSPTNINFFWSSPQSGLIRLTADMPNHPEAFNALTSVKANDKVHVSVHAYWGQQGGSFNCFSGCCKRTDQDGYYESDSFQTLDGYGNPRGMMISDGIQAQFIGSNGTKYVGNAGHLLLGFNAPESSGVCSNYDDLSITVTHCEDASGVSYRCL